MHNHSFVYFVCQSLILLDFPLVSSFVHHGPPIGTASSAPLSFPTAYNAVSVRLNAKDAAGDYHGLRLSEEQQKTFEEDGLLVLRGIVSNEDVEELRRRLDNRRVGVPFKDRMTNTLMDSTEFVVGIHDTSFEKVTGFYHRKKFTEACAELLGAPTLRFWTDFIGFNPWKESSDIGWHVDTTVCGGMNANDVIRCWFPLDECDPNLNGGGCEYILGSHRAKVNHSNGAIQESDLPEGEVARLHLYPGDVVVWHPGVVHKTVFSPKGVRIRAMGSTFFREDAAMDPEVTETARLWATEEMRIYGHDASTAYNTTYAPIVYPDSRCELGERVLVSRRADMALGLKALGHHVSKRCKLLMSQGNHIGALRFAIELYTKAFGSMCHGVLGSLNPSARNV